MTHDFVILWGGNRSYYLCNTVEDAKAKIKKFELDPRKYTIFVPHYEKNELTHKEKVEAEIVRRKFNITLLEKDIHRLEMELK